MRIKQGVNLFQNVEARRLFCVGRFENDSCVVHIRIIRFSIEWSCKKRWRLKPEFDSSRLDRITNLYSTMRNRENHQYVIIWRPKMEKWSSTPTRFSKWKMRRFLFYWYHVIIDVLSVDFGRWVFLRENYMTALEYDLCVSGTKRRKKIGSNIIRRHGSDEGVRHKLIHIIIWFRRKYMTF